MKTLFVITVALSLSGCIDPAHCKKWEIIKTVGQCSYHGGLKYSTCVALTEEGNRLESGDPYVAGEKVCTE